MCHTNWCLGCVCLIITSLCSFISAFLRQSPRKTKDNGGYVWGAHAMPSLSNAFISSFLTLLSFSLLLPTHTYIFHSSTFLQPIWNSSSFMPNQFSFFGHYVFHHFFPTVTCLALLGYKAILIFTFSCMILINYYYFLVFLNSHLVFINYSINIILYCWALWRLDLS